MKDDKLKKAKELDDDLGLSKNKKGNNVFDEEEEDVDIDNKKKDLDDLFDEEILDEEFESEEDSLLEDSEDGDSDWDDIYGYTNKDEFET